MTESMYKKYSQGARTEELNSCRIPSRTLCRWRKRSRLLSTSTDSQDPCTSELLANNLRRALHPEEINENETDCSTDEPVFTFPEETQSLLYDGARISQGESLILIMNFILKHNVSNKLLDDLLDLINIHCPKDCVPNSKYHFEKMVSCPKEQIARHYFCSKCQNYLAPDSQIGTLLCDFCAEEQARTTSNYFLTLPLEPQIRNLLENVTYLEKVVFPDGKLHTDENLNDLCDGNKYQALLNNPFCPLGQNYSLSLSVGFDGVPVFSSSSFSVWPILCIINEINIKCRKNHALIQALWFGKDKPDVDTLFTPVLQEYQRLCHQGLQWKHPQLNVMVTSRVVVTVVVCDSVARPMLQGIKQFNGYSSCNFCLHPGQHIKKGNGGFMGFPPGNLEYTNRTHDMFLNDSRIAIETDKPVNGVTRFPVLVEIPFFDVVQGFVPDYMHAVLLGVVRSFTCMWFDKKYHLEEWYLGALTEDVDARLCKIKPPLNISRVPRSVTTRKYWKAHEWRAWLLYFSLPVLEGILPEAYLIHWGLLVHAIACLLQESVPKTLLGLCKDMLLNFVKGVRTLYGVQFCSYNVHLCSHLVQSVENWGPLWSHSAFVFEGFNQTVLSFVRSSNSVPLQICHKYIALKFLPTFTQKTLALSQVNPSIHFQTLQEKLNSNHIWLKQVKRFAPNLIALGKPYSKVVHDDDKQAISRYRLRNSQTEVSFVSGAYYHRIIINGQIVHSKKYKKVTKRNSYIVLLESGQIFEIGTFLHLNDLNCLYAVGYHLHSLPQTLFPVRLPNLRLACKDKSLLAVVPCLQIKQKCVLVERSDSTYNFVFYLINEVEAQWL